MHLSEVDAYCVWLAVLCLLFLLQLLHMCVVIYLAVYVLGPPAVLYALSKSPADGFRGLLLAVAAANAALSRLISLSLSSAANGPKMPIQMHILM